MNATPDVSIVVVSFNTKELLLRCLRSVFAETRAQRFEVVVVDNASQDGSAQAVAEQFPSVRLERAADNLGFGRAVNRGAALASGRYLLLLNPDTIVLDGAIDRLVALAEKHADAGIYGGATVDEDGRPDGSSCWNRPTLLGAFCQASGLAALAPPLRRSVVRLGDATAQHVDIVSGGFLLIRRALWDELGGFDERFFLYGEDYDLNLRALARGARPLVFPAVRIVHRGGGSRQGEADRLVRLLGAFALLYELHWSPSAARAGRACLRLWVLTRRLGYRLAGSPHARDWDEVWKRRGAFLRGSRATEPPHR